MGGTVFKVAVLVSHSDLNSMMEQFLVGIRARKVVNSGTGIYRIPTERRPGFTQSSLLLRHCEGDCQQSNDDETSGKWSIVSYCAFLVRIEQFFRR